MQLFAAGSEPGTLARGVQKEQVFVSVTLCCVFLWCSERGLISGS